MIIPREELESRRLLNVTDLIDKCAAITKSKGFDVTQHRTQLCLVATEVAEALGCASESDNEATDTYSEHLIYHANKYELYRRCLPKPHNDTSKIFYRSRSALLEELADICIRVFSYVGGNGWGDKFATALATKMKKNAERPHMHGKGF